MKPIYLDYAATTPLDPRVAKKMSHYLTREGTFGNPASLHVYGKEAKEAVEIARAQVATEIHANPSEIIWTSGATESNNLALKGAARLYQRKGKHIITMTTEHKAVLDTCLYLEKIGLNVSFLKPTKKGQIDLDLLRASIQKDTILVSVMHVNNETGIIQDLAAIANITSQEGILFHVDAAQSIGKVALDVSQVPIDLLSLSAHKCYGPKGIGALYLRQKPRVRVEPLIHGGGHEQGMRSGTLATHQIVGMGDAFSLASKDDATHIHFLRDRFLKGIAHLKRIIVNCDLSLTTPHIISLRFDGMLADAVLTNLPMIAASTGSACLGKGAEGSYVLHEMGLTLAQIKSSIRFSLGRFTTIEDIDAVVRAIKELKT